MSLISIEFPENGSMVRAATTKQSHWKARYSVKGVEKVQKTVIEEEESVLRDDNKLPRTLIVKQRLQPSQPRVKDLLRVPLLPNRPKLDPSASINEVTANKDIQKAEVSYKLIKLGF